MDILKGHGIGYAKCNFRGPFGILDSGRKEIEYEGWHGHKLDRKLLAIACGSLGWPVCGCYIGYAGLLRQVD